MFANYIDIIHSTFLKIARNGKIKNAVIIEAKLKINDWGI